MRIRMNFVMVNTAQINSRRGRNLFSPVRACVETRSGCAFPKFGPVLRSFYFNVLKDLLDVQAVMPGHDAGNLVQMGRPKDCMTGRPLPVFRT